MAIATLPGSTSGLLPPPILVGVSNVQSGPSRSLGEELVRGSRSYFDLVNSTGGIHGRRVSLIVKDDQYEPEPAIRNTNDLIAKEKVFFLFDYIGTPTLTRVLPLLRYYREEGIVNVAPFTGADPQRQPPYDAFVFNIRASYREETHALVDYLLSKGFRNIGFVGQADSYGKSGQVGVEEALRNHGLQIVASVAYRRNAASAGMRAQVDYLMSKHADAVICVGVYGPCGTFITEARLAHWQVPVANVSFVNAEAMLTTLRQKSKELHLDLTTNLINSQVVPYPNSPAHPLVRAYLAHLGQQHLPSFTSLEGWINAAVATEGLRRAGPNPSREKFKHAMESLGGWDPGIGYRLQFSPTEHQGLHKVWLTKTQNGAWVAEPEEIRP